MLKAKAAPSVGIVTTLLTGGSILALTFLPEKGAVCCCVKTCDVGVRVRVGVLVFLLICYVIWRQLTCASVAALVGQH